MSKTTITVALTLKQAGVHVTITIFGEKKIGVAYKNGHLTKLGDLFTHLRLVTHFVF
jgi:hypothetical protein